MSEFDVNRSQQTDKSTTVRWVLSHLSHHKLLILAMLAGAFGNAALAAVVPVLIGMAFDAALETPANLQMIGWMALGVIASQSTRAVLQLGRNFSSAVMGERLERDMREELYVSLLGKSTTFHDSQPVGDTMARATNDVHEVNLLMNPGVNLVAGSANFMIMPLLVAPTYHPQLAAAPLFFIVTYILAVTRYLRVLQGIADRVRRAFGMLNGRLAEAIDGIELVKGTAQEVQEIGLFNNNATRYRDAAVEQGKIEARFLPLLLLGVTQGIGFTHALYLFNLEQIAVGDVVGYMGLLALFGFPTFISLLAYSRVSLGLAGARRILELMNAQTLLDENAAGHQAEIVGGVTFEDVTFNYVDGAPVLQAIDFSIEPGQTVAVVGQTGAGKSTLAKLINRTYDVENGRLLVDDIDVRTWNLAALRRQISIIEQDIFLFSRTVGENIAFGCPDASREMIIEAAKAAQAHDFILNFKDGYETVIGERGVTLSGGQRQRLALARAFLTRPRILILDDSTSAVDSATEDQIQQAIVQAAANQTTILITHRLSQIRWADKVVVMRKGRMEAVGSHEELMGSSPAYRRIFEQYEAIEE
ncbi:ABC transporter ATP-binding protein [Candidatus Leptofilum sp.]|uniref:ABC transporter ATP-binding protein n=1 Tax=Candidatus Leptofilum sp. TaxID=3241576 RepID=UPI003B5AF854